MTEEEMLLEVIAAFVAAMGISDADPEYLADSDKNEVVDVYLF